MLLFDYLQKINLPNIKIIPNGIVCDAFLKNNIFAFWDAIQYINQLPYGRTIDRENYLSVLNEKRGACSTKHALIAALARELNIPLKLMLGIYLLTPENTPKIKEILEEYHLQTIPEAHCYLQFNDKLLDITFPDAANFSLNLSMEYEQQITSSQIGEFKVKKHHEFIIDWIKDNKKLSFEMIWKAREKWIQTLS